MKTELTENIKCPVSFYPPTERTELKRVKVFVSSTSLNFSLDSIALQKALRRPLFNRENVFIKTLVKLIANTSRETPKQVITNRSHKIIIIIIIIITSNLSKWHCLPPFSVQSHVITMIQVLALYVLLLLLSLHAGGATQTNSSSRPVHINGCSIPVPFIYKTKFTSACNKHDVCYSCVSFKLTTNLQCIERRRLL